MLSFKQFYILNEEIKMQRIPHFHQMTVDELAEFLVGSNWENTEKIDGQNSSIGIENNLAFVKSKKGKPTFNPNEFFSIGEKIENMMAFGNLLKMIQQNNFVKWNKDITLKYIKFLKTKSKIINSITIFGELLNAPQMNSLMYDASKIGTGTFVVFGSIINDGKNGVNISTSKEGIEIMKDFVQTFNTKDNWNIYFKHKVDLKFDQKFVSEIKTFIIKNRDIIKSRKRDSASLVAKQKALDELQTLVMKFKGILLKQIHNKRSFLGDKTNIEGIVSRNINNGAITKIVDTEYFTALNMKNWGVRDSIGGVRKTLYERLIKDIVNSSDIFLMKGKQEEKAIGYLETSGKDHFDSLEELLDVYYRDAKEEVELKSARDVARELESIFNEYKGGIKQLQSNLDKDQSDAKKKIDDRNYSITSNLLKHEIENSDKFMKEIKTIVASKKDPYLKIISYIIGPKGIEELSNKFLKGK